MKFANRKTFLNSPEGKIVEVWKKVDPNVHSTEVLAEITANKKLSISADAKRLGEEDDRARHFPERRAIARRAHRIQIGCVSYRVKSSTSSALQEFIPPSSYRPSRPPRSGHAGDRSELQVSARATTSMGAKSAGLRMAQPVLNQISWYLCGAGTGRWFHSEWKHGPAFSRKGADKAIQVLHFVRLSPKGHRLHANQYSVSRRIRSCNAPPASTRPHSTRSKMLPGPQLPHPNSRLIRSRLIFLKAKQVG
jgi:hypothetical protein